MYLKRKNNLNSIDCPNIRIHPIDLHRSPLLAMKHEFKGKKRQQFIEYEHWT